ncbi:MAG: hypothetical protein CSA64_02310 [Arachnia propionica]|nr:MAG: hypothetical protein CSA64_02310 [Arachnia propionica]
MPPQPSMRPGPPPGPMPPVPPPGSPMAAPNPDSQWQRLHPLTPWVSIMSILAVFAFALVPLGFALLLGDSGWPSLIPLLIVAGFLLAIVSEIVNYYVTRFRLTNELFEMRTGVISKQHRQVRLDRLQSVNLNRPIAARVFGLTILETSGAGQDSDIKVRYLKKEDADALRAEILRRASGVRHAQRQAAAGPIAPPSPAGASQAAAVQPGAAAVAPRPRRNLSDYIESAIVDFTSPELAAGEVNERAIVRVAPARIIGAAALPLLVAILVIIVVAAVLGLFTFLVIRAGGEEFLGVLSVGLWTVALSLLGPGLFVGFIGSLSSLASSLQYSIAGTPDGLRIGRGLLTQTNDTVAPGRIHSLQINQPFYWRPFGWYSVTMNRADLQVQLNENKNDRQNNVQRQVLLPVGNYAELQRVLSLALPMHMSPNALSILAEGMKGGRRAPFITAPKRAWWLKPFSHHRTGYVIENGLIYLRSGWLRRRLALIPGERIQGVTIKSGPLRRLARVATISPDTVGGPVVTSLDLVDQASIYQLHEAVEQLAITAAKMDTSHRWREAQTRLTLASARMQVEDARRLGQEPPAQAMRVLWAEEQWLRTQRPAGQAPPPGQSTDDGTTPVDPPGAPASG